MNSFIWVCKIDIFLSFSYRDAINGTEIDYEPIPTWFWFGGSSRPNMFNQVIKDEDLPLEPSK